MVLKLLNIVIKLTILNQIILRKTKEMVFALEEVEKATHCIGKYQIKLEKDLKFVVEDLAHIHFIDFDKVPDESILERNNNVLFIHLKYNDKVPTIKADLETFFATNGTFRLHFLYFEWFERVSEILDYENLTFPGELHALFYNEEANSFEHSLTMDKGVIALAFDIEINPFPKYNFKDLYDNLKFVEDSYALRPIPNNNLEEYWLNANRNRFYMYEGSLLQFLCNSSVIWIDFVQPLAMPPEVVEGIWELKDEEMNPIMKGFNPIFKPRGKVFAISPQIAGAVGAPPIIVYPDTDENNYISGGDEAELGFKELGVLIAFLSFVLTFFQ